VNVWLLLIEKRITGATERALGPFTSVAIESDRIVDNLTGLEIIHRLPATGGAWGQGDGRTGHFDRIVIQQGGFESPWGERGR
jgi:hypothetical protein